MRSHQSWLRVCKEAQELPLIKNSKYKESYEENDQPFHLHSCCSKIGMECKRSHQQIENDHSDMHESPP